MTQVQSRPVGKRIGGLALMLVAVAMIGLCTRFLALSGNCSITEAEFEREKAKLLDQIEITPGPLFGHRN